MRWAAFTLLALSVALALLACAKKAKPRPQYGDECPAMINGVPTGPGCFYLGDEFTGMPMIEVFPHDDGDAASTKGRERR